MPSQHHAIARTLSAFAAFALLMLPIGVVEAQSASPPFSELLPPLSELQPDNDELHQLMPLVEQGDASAQFQLGTKHLRGRRVEKNAAEGLRWMRASGEQGFVKAQLYLGNYYADVAHDDTEALAWFRRAATKMVEKDGVIAARKAGVILSRNAGTAGEAARYFRQGADRGDPRAQVLLGLLYLDGNGVEKDVAEGLKLIEEAATPVYRVPTQGLVFVHAEVYGRAPNILEAASRASRSARVQRDMDAFYAIGAFYQTGSWIEKDDKPILSWVFARMKISDEAIRRFFDNQRVSASYRWADPA